MGAGQPSSPGRYTTPLPASPRYVSSPLPPTAGVSGSPGRYTSALQHVRQRSDSQQSAPGSYRERMGVHVAPGGGLRRDYGGEDVVDRFVLPRSGGSTGSGYGSVPRGSPAAAAEMGEYASGSGSVKPVASEREREREREKGVPVPGPRVGTPGGVGGAASGSLGAAGGSAPSALAINPFKSSTLSRSGLSSSLLRGVPGSPGRATSPITGPGPGTVAFPQPAPAESGGLAGSAGAVGVGIPVRKRYSSSFSHRYGAVAGSSVGSGGSGESGSTSGSALGLAAREPAVQSRKATPDQQDEISSFVKEIDSARPLLGRYRQDQQQQQQQQSSDADADEPSPTSASTTSGASRGSTVRASSTGARTIGPGAFDPPAATAMLTTEAAVDERLKRMNEEFMRSLEGLGGPRRSRTSSLGAASPMGGSGSGSGSAQGSQEVLGRLEYDYDAQGRMR
ncbi:hypothetical protein FB45DRAFT_362730 [Roridomyces roridus]|uniref:Uncharacterized protein n=1 Tax=Roridomyces roridus TaxID=1738132 RepID=A0AAD7FVV9_9AGAR|nr:hypothetical protein FB45DRAFT_362730 [Roridomyces roridus]